MVCKIFNHLDDIIVFFCTESFCIHLLRVFEQIHSIMRVYGYVRLYTISAGTLQLSGYFSQHLNSIVERAILRNLGTEVVFYKVFVFTERATWYYLYRSDTKNYCFVNMDVLFQIRIE